jgi:DMSO/TMAO reductase YedYZ heme-binding membrane subunit
MNSHALWYLSRGSGIVVLLLLTLAVVAGIATSGRWSTRRWPRFVVQGLHRNLSLLATVFLGVHISSTVLDTYVNIRWIDAVLPFHAAYKPLWLGLGALAFDLFLALAITSLIRSRLGYRTWKSVHWLAYGCWGLGLLHGLGIGSDRHQTWTLCLYAASAAAVAAATLVRLAPIMRRAIAPAAS